MGGGQRKQIWKLPIILTQSSLHTKHPILWSQICGLIPYIHLGLLMGVYHSGLASFCRWRSHLKPPFPDDVPAVSHMPNLSIFSHMVPYSPIWSHILPYDFIFSHRFPYISIFPRKKHGFWDEKHPRFSFLLLGTVQVTCQLPVQREDHQSRRVPCWRELSWPQEIQAIFHTLW